MTHAQPALEPEIPLIRFRGRIFVPLISGALHWPEMDALLVADLHLEKLSSFARSGRLLPPYDTGMTLSRLEADIAATGARRVVALGDSFHTPHGPHTLPQSDHKRLSSLLARTEWTWLSGNHDPVPHALGGRCRAELAVSGYRLRHHPAPGVAGLIAGHLHPAARIALNGKSTRRPCFVWDETLLILPAYGASTGSLNILSPAFSGLFDRRTMQVLMTGRDRVYPVGTARLVGG